MMQITDCHLFAQSGDRLMGVDTTETLDWVLELAASLDRPDRLLLTGDLAQDGSVAAYAKLRDRIAGLQAPASWICGNHDNAEAMADALVDQPQALGKLQRMGNWQLILLHTQVEDEVGGFLAESELALVEQSLKDFEGHSLIAMHHHPLAMDSQWMDRIAIANSEQLWQKLSHAQGKVVLLCGHVHQQQELQRDGIELFTTPATCFQFSPHSREFGVTDEMPGLRTFELYDDGSVSSRVHRVSGRKLSLNRELMGY
ncbi:metallophosphoesterase [Aestuariirhabdus sp. Z084]|uniref:metallophosphoesterase n=1 Tax=Aestuariirhabdus haliotis TaxID=2918751 RepID=UPI00201B43C1|nr:metallophosphoesterase [Aestuariirhabdus haliotis]MCL6415613.1 metallophosphoesterase [Aestuariirhabdus haliotis]MCL6419608.1 metallophosphoesterase [Aestuariirhabdus haliotis]